MEKGSVAMQDTSKTPNVQEKKTPGEKPSLVKELISWVEIIVVAVVLALLINNFVIVNATVPSGSMEDTIEPGNRLLGTRFSYWFSDPKRGDIVVFKYPVNEALIEKLTDDAGKTYLKSENIKHTNYIKRIIGLPGETVEIRSGKVYIDGSEEPLDEPYLKDEEWIRRNDGITFQVPEDCYLMMGDNRNNSSDARYWKDIALQEFANAGSPISEEEAESLQYVKRSQFLGKAYFRYWPLTKISSLY